jgi:hypothetical protein
MRIVQELQHHTPRLPAADYGSCALFALRLLELLQAVASST